MEAFFFCEIASVLGQEIELLKNHVIIRSHGSFGETAWKSLSGELEGKTAFPFGVCCPSRSGMK